MSRVIFVNPKHRNPKTRKIRKYLNTGPRWRVPLIPFPTWIAEFEVLRKQADDLIVTALQVPADYLTPEGQQAISRRMDATLAEFNRAVANIIITTGMSEQEAGWIVTEMHNPAPDTWVMLAERLNIPRARAQLIIGQPTDRPYTRLLLLNGYFEAIGVAPPEQQAGQQEQRHAPD